jgi:hypothetical protein
MIDALLGDMEQYEEARAALQQLVDETLEAEMSAILAVQEAQNEADRQYQESRAVLAEEIRRAGMTEQQREIEDLELFYAKRIEMAKFYGLDVVALEADFEEKKNEIINDRVKVAVHLIRYRRSMGRELTEDEECNEVVKVFGKDALQLLEGI